MMNEKDIAAVSEAVSKMKSQGVPDDAFTTREFIDASNHGRDWCNNLLRLAMKEGFVEYVGKKPITYRIGQSHSVPHYRFVKKKRKETKSDD